MLSSDQTTDWVKALIDESNSDEIVVIHEKNESDAITLIKDAGIGLKDLINQNKGKNSPYVATYEFIKANSTFFENSERQLSMFYAESESEDSTKFTAVFYSEG